MVLLLALACSSPEERFARHISRAEGYVDEGRVDDALIELQSALKIEPGDPDVNEQLARLLKQRGSVQAAAFHFGETYRLDPSRVEAAVEQAVLLWQTAPRRARQIITGARRRFPEDARVHRGEASIAAAMNQLDEALAAGERAVKLAPEDPESWATLGAIYMQRTRDARKNGQDPDPAEYAAGIAAFDELDAVSEGHVGARVEKARLLGRMDAQEEAVAAFRSAIALAKERDNPGGVVHAGRRFAGYAERIGSTPLEIEALREIVSAAPESARQWEALSLVVERQEGIEAAEALYAELLETRPELPAAHIAYASFLARNRRELDAIAHLDRSIAGGLDTPALWEQLVRLELRLRRIADARATVAEMKNRLGDHEATRRSEAHLAVQEHRAEDALTILREFTGQKESAETEMLRARAERELDNTSAALVAAERAVALAPRQDASALRLKASIHADAGDWEAALRSLDRIRARGQELAPHERVIEARAHYELGNSEKGKSILEAVLEGRTSPAGAAVEYAQREAAAHPAEAHRYLAKALARAPGNYATLSAITKLDLAEGRDGAALRRLDELVESQLAGPRVLLLRSQVLLRGGQLDRAEADALRAFEALPDLIDAVDLLFTIYSAQNKIDEARRSFEEANSLGVLHRGARVLLARLQAAQGDTEQAKALYEAVLAEDDGMVAAKHDLARLLASEEEDLDRALGLVEDAQRAVPDDPAIADTVGFIYLLQGRNEVALQQFRMALDLSRALDIAPPAVHYHLGLALAALGRSTEAASAFEQALEIDPGFQGADDARAQLEAARTATATGSSP
jgi:tetratricopeptide (TPR) repeat protein